MKNLLTGATIVAILALAPAALAVDNGPHGQRFITDTLGGNGQPAYASTAAPAPSPNENTASASAALQGYTTSGPRLSRAKPQGYRFITDTLGGNGGAPLASVATGGNSFDWTDAGIGAASGLGTALILIGGSLVVLRKRGRLAV